MAKTLQFAGRDRTLRFRPSTAGLFEESMGQTLTEALPKMGFKALSTLLWLGFRNEDDRMTTARAIDGIDTFVESGGDISELWHLVIDQLTVDGHFGRDAAIKAQGKAEAGGVA